MPTSPLRSWTMIGLALTLILCACTSAPTTTATIVPTVGNTDIPPATATPSPIPDTAIPPTETATLLPSATAAPPSPTTQPPTPTWTPEASFDGLRVTYIHTAGFLITAGDQKVLIDALFQGYRAGEAPRADLLEAMVAGTPPFDDLDLILVTHDHRDHYDQELVYQHLLRNPETQFVSTNSIVEGLAGRNASLAARLQGLDLHTDQHQALTAAGIELEAFYISHGDPAVPNLGYLIRLGEYSLFHTGDMVADAIQVSELQAFGLPELELDVAFVPSYSLLDPGYQALTTEGIQAKYVIPMHYSYLYPPLDMPEVYPGAIVFSDTMRSWVMPDPDAALANGPPIEVPVGVRPILDGSLDVEEWATARVELLSDGSQLFLMQDGAYLYLGLRDQAAGGGVATIFLDQGQQVSLLHSSAALGTAIYSQVGENWALTQRFVWKCRDTGNSASAQAARDAFLESEGWLANNGLMGTPQEFEYMLLLPEDGLRLSVAYLGPPNFDTLATWPLAPQDANQSITLVTGPIPEQASFARETWAWLVPAGP